MRRYWTLAGMGLLAVGLAVGVAIAATGAGGPPQGWGQDSMGPPHGMGGPPPDGPGPGMGGPGGPGRGMGGPGRGMGGPGGPGRGMGGPGGQRGPGGPMIVGRDLEAVLGKPLTDDQRKAVADATKTMHEAVQAAHEAFIKTVADATGLTVDQVREAVPLPLPGAGQKGPPPGAGWKGPPPPAGKAPPAQSPSGS
jgi:hypothetical protein